MERKPYWVSYVWENSFSPVSGETLERVLPQGIRSRRAKERLKEQIRQLVTNNLENLRWRTLQSIESSYRRFGSELDARLADTISATHEAIRAAHSLRSEQNERVSATLTVLQSRITEIQDDIGQLRSLQHIPGGNPVLTIPKSDSNGIG
jgi:metal-responsive CopG/Arc/MetJ family transcriptional regulator